MSATTRVIVDPGPSRPPSRAELLSLVQRLLAQTKTITTPLGWHYRAPLVKEAERALDAARRFGQLPAGR